MKFLLITVVSIFASAVAVNQSVAQDLIECVSSASDSDRDGYGWENDDSCIVVTGPPAVGVLNQCDVRRDDNGEPVCLDESGMEEPDLFYCEDVDGDGDFFGPFGACSVNSTNSVDSSLVSNGTFSNGSAGWNTYLHPDSVAGPFFTASGGVGDPDPYAAEFTFREESRNVSFSYRTAGTQWWHSQLISDPVSLEGGRTYRLSFSAITNPRGGSPVGSVVVENGANYTKYLDRHDFAVGVLVFRYHYAEFFVPASDSNARIAFNLGDNYGGDNSVNVGSFDIDNVRLIALDTNSDQQDSTAGCDYSNASIHDGWGYNFITGDSCSPQNVERGACVDSDGDGWGWDGIDSCEVN